jgi:L-asparaginase / beta-aspartyl-peptidase
VADVDHVVVLYLSHDRKSKRYSLIIWSHNNHILGNMISGYTEMPVSFGIMIHGGAGAGKIKKSSKNAQEISEALENSISVGYEILEKSAHRGNGNDAVDAVELTVASMEDSGVFNASIGSCLTLDKRIEMDASIMDGNDLAAGSVGMVQQIQNPVKLARQVMERTDHVLLVSEGASELAKLFNMEIALHAEPSKEKLDRYDVLCKKMKNTWARNYELLTRSQYSPLYKKKKNSNNNNQIHYGTVGAVAIDRHANVAAAVSTGGRWLKLHGRVGDSAVIGAGIYADNDSGAACATGDGEFIMKLCLSKYTCDLMKETNKNDNTASEATKKAINLLTKKFGSNSGGIIAVDTKGRFGMSINTESMPIAIKSSKYGNGKTKFAFEKYH